MEIKLKHLQLPKHIHMFMKAHYNGVDLTDFDMKYAWWEDVFGIGQYWGRIIETKILTLQKKFCRTCTNKICEHTGKKNPPQYAYKNCPTRTCTAKKQSNMKNFENCTTCIKKTCSRNTGQDGCPEKEYRKYKSNRCKDCARREHMDTCGYRPDFYDDKRCMGFKQNGRYLDCFYCKTDSVNMHYCDSSGKQCSQEISNTCSRWTNETPIFINPFEQYKLDIQSEVTLEKYIETLQKIKELADSINFKIPVVFDENK